MIFCSHTEYTVDIGLNTGKKGQDQNVENKKINNCNKKKYHEPNAQRKRMCCFSIVVYIYNTLNETE